MSNTEEAGRAVLESGLRCNPIGPEIPSVAGGSSAITLMSARDFPLLSVGGRLSAREPLDFPDDPLQFVYKPRPT